jgi:hypothetical protein
MPLRRGADGVRSRRHPVRCAAGAPLIARRWTRPLRRSTRRSGSAAVAAVTAVALRHARARAWADAGLLSLGAGHPGAAGIPGQIRRRIRLAAGAIVERLLAAAIVGLVAAGTSHQSRGARIAGSAGLAGLAWRRARAAPAAGGGAGATCASASAPRTAAAAAAAWSASLATSRGTAGRARSGATSCRFVAAGGAGAGVAATGAVTDPIIVGRSRAATDREDSDCCQAHPQASAGNHVLAPGGAAVAKAKSLGRHAGHFASDVPTVHRSAARSAAPPAATFWVQPGHPTEQPGGEIRSLSPAGALPAPC